MKTKKGRGLQRQVEYWKAFIITFSAAMFVFPIATTACFQTIYEIKVGDEVVAYAASQEDIDAAMREARYQKGLETGELVIVENLYSAQKIQGNAMKIKNVDRLTQVMYEELDKSMKIEKVLAYTIKVNDYMATVATKEDVITILEQAQAGYDVDDTFAVGLQMADDKESGIMDVCVAGGEPTASANETQPVSAFIEPAAATTESGATTEEGATTESGATIEEGAATEESHTDQDDEVMPISETEGTNPVNTDGIKNIDFNEDIEVTSCYVSKDKLQKTEDVLADITTPRDEKTTYEVKSGDCLSTIAQDHDMDMDGLISMNEGLTVESTIVIGDELNVVVPKTEVSILVDEQETYDEKYNLDTEYVDDSSLFIGNDVVTQEAVEGERTVTALVQYNNGKEYNREILNEIVKVEAQPKIVHRGTKAVPTYMCPLSNPRITSPFGKRKQPKAGASTYHKGIDYGIPVGTAVFATRGGRVTSAGWLGGYGYCVVIDHGDGITSRYGHLSKPLVSAGQYVKQGEKIALSGNTGNSTGPHLHFEMRSNGEAVNPAEYLN